VTDRTKLIIAITAGLIGLALAIFATIVAVNARNTAESDASVQAEVSREVEQRLGEELRKQSEKEQRQISSAERFIQTLSKDERKAFRQIANLNGSVGALRREVDQMESNQANEYSSLDKRVTRIENQIRQIQRKLDSVGG
jgi:predicted  nucleic acid-binding Zn-ribbon protein